MTDLLDIEVPLDADAVARSLERRISLLQECDGNVHLQEIQKAMCAADPVHFFNNFVVTYDPRLITYGLPAYVPFDLFPRQEELIRWLDARVERAEEGLLEKSRDVGWTWVAAGYAGNKWLFIPGFRTTFGSRKVDLVDKLGDPDSILEKVRLLIDRLPAWMLPKGWRKEAHANHCKITNPENGNVIGGEGGAEMGRGGRAAQPLDAKILTPCGWVEMRDVRPGDLVIGSQGKPIKVTGVYPLGVKPVYRVTFSDGSTTHCCDDHWWHVTDRMCRKVIARNGNRTYGRRFHLLRLKDLKDELLIHRPDGQTEFKYRIPICQPIQFEQVDLPLHPYLLGSLLGDGSLSQIKRSPVGFTTADSESILLLAPLLPVGMKFTKNSGKYDYDIVCSNGGRHGPGVKNELKAAIFYLKLDGSLSYNKFIPDIYKFSSPEDRLELIRGLLDTDGWLGIRRDKPKSSNKVCFASTSEQLVKDLVEVVQSLGGVANIISRPGARRMFPQGRFHDCRESYQVTITMPMGMNPFKLSRKAVLYKERNKYKPSRSMVCVVPIGESEVQCISVDAEDGLYVTDDFIVTHNTLYIVDEAAYIDHADSAAAAILANAETRIWASSVNGPGDLFAKKRHDGTLRPDQIFTFHWSDDPRKTAEWARKKKKELSSTPWMFAKEYDIDYTASVEGICIPAAWVKAAVKLGELIPFKRSEAACVAGLDIGDTCARSVLQPRFGPLLVPPESWGLPDTTNTAFEALDAAKRIGVTVLNYDSIGVGKGVQSTMTLNPVKGITVRPINVGMPASWRTVWPDGQTSRMKCANLKAELWLLARERFRCSAEHLVWMTGEEITGIEPKEHEVSDLFLFEPAPAHVYRETIVQLSQPVRQFDTKGKSKIESKDDLAKRGVASPDFAEGLILSLVPVDVDSAASVAPIVAYGQRGYPELGGGAPPLQPTVRSTSSTPDRVSPVVPTGRRFDGDFSREW